MAFGAAWCVAITSLAVSSGASVRMVYSAPAKCPDEAALRAQLGARLGYDPVREPASQDVTVTVAESDGRLGATMKIAGHAERVFPGGPNDCESLVEGVALALAIALDPGVLVRARQPAVTAPPPTPTAVDAADVRTESAVVVSVTAGLRSAYGLLPIISFGPTIEGRIRHRSFSAALEVDGAFSPGLTVEGGSITTSMMRAAAQLCGHAGLAAICLRGSGGALSASGSGFENSRRGWLAVATIGPAVSLGWRPLAGLLLQAGGGLELVLLRHTIAIGSRDVWKSPLFAGNVTLSAGWQIP